MSQDEFWDRIEKVNAGMLDTSQGQRLVPMSHYADRPLNCLWFITAKGTDAVDATTAGPVDCAYVVADGKNGLFTHVKGSLSLSGDTAKLDALWNPVADAWFEGGKHDPDVRLLCLHITGAEVWTTPTSGIAFMFKIAASQLTGNQPDMGEHFML